MKTYLRILLPLLLLPILVHAQRGGPSSNIVKWAKLRSTQMNINPIDSTQRMSGQEQYTLQISLADTTGISAFRISASNASLQSTINNQSYDLSNQRIYRSPKNGDYIVYIDLGSRPVGSVKNGNVQALGRGGAVISGPSSKSFSKP